ncbi:MAG: LysM peptidoglycan-binding domain-containing protein [Anaerolineae bacterium]
MKNVQRREIAIGLLIGLAIGVPALVLALLLSRPGTEPLAAPTSSVPTTVIEVLPTLTTAPTATATPVGAPSPTTPAVTPSPEPIRMITYTVETGDVLGAIALEYDVSVEAIMEASGLEDADFIRAGDVLTIPLGGEVEELAAAEATAAISPTIATSMTSGIEPVSLTEEDIQLLAAGYPASLEGNRSTAYPKTLETARYVVHYTPDTYPEKDLEAVQTILDRGLAHIEHLLESEIDGTFDVYVPGSIFGSPNHALRGRSFSAARRFYFLHDSTGNAADQQYMATHEMTHLFAWNVFGRPVSAMLSEGVAVYAGMTAIEDSEHLSPQIFCRAYADADTLPSVSSSLAFDGKFEDLPNYYAAGCFVQYLIETYGVESFSELYPTGNYLAIYGKSLSALESEWKGDLLTSDYEEELDPEALLEATALIADAYDELFADFDATPSEWESYVNIDAARIALLEGRLDDVATYLAAQP